MTYSQRIKILFFYFLHTCFYFSVVPLYTQVHALESDQTTYLFTTLFINTAGKKINGTQFVECDNKKLSTALTLYDNFFKKNYPEVLARQYCEFFSQESLSAEDSAVALAEYLKNFRLCCNKKGIEPILQCEIFGDRAAEIFCATVAYSESSDIPQVINTVSFYNVSCTKLSHAALTSLLIQRAYFFLQKDEKESKPIVGGTEKNGARIMVFCDTLPPTIEYPFWVFSPVFLRHLWVLASSTAEISLSHDEKSALLICGNNTVDVSNALFPCLKSVSTTVYKASIFAKLTSFLKSRSF